MNSYFDYINLNSIHIIFDKLPNKKDKKHVLDPRSPTQRSPSQRSPNKRSPNIRRQSPPKLSLASAGEWEKEYPHCLSNNMDFLRFNLNSIIEKSSVPILSYT
jgi:hypothetical protein